MLSPGGARGVEKAERLLSRAWRRYGLSPLTRADFGVKYWTPSLWLDPCAGAQRIRFPGNCVSRGRFLRRYPVDLLLEFFLWLATPFQNLLAVLNHLRMAAKIGDAVLAGSPPHVGVLP